MNDTPAFPCEVLGTDEHGEYRMPWQGMTLRDYFAAKALMGMMASRNPSTPRFDPEDDAAYVYMVADAMLKARSK